MEQSLSVSQVRSFIENAIEAFPHDECATCECFLGYVTQLEMEADDGGQKFLEKHKPQKTEMHACLGCDPCPPGDHYAQYLRENRAA